MHVLNPVLEWLIVDTKVEQSICRHSQKQAIILSSFFTIALVSSANILCTLESHSQASHRSNIRLGFYLEQANLARLQQLHIGEELEGTLA